MFTASWALSAGICWCKNFATKCKKHYNTCRDLCVDIFCRNDMQQSNIRIFPAERMLENRVPHNPAEGKLLWSLILSWTHHVSYIQRYLTDACRQEQQNLSAAKRDNHLLTPSLYLCCHERKSWTLTLLQWASVSTICTAPTKPNNEYSALT